MSTTAPEGFGLVIKTNSYTGNFEREMCAFLTGQVGECEVGKELKDVLLDKPDFEHNIQHVADDHGCYRPCSLHEKNSNSMIIFFHTKPTEEQINWIKAHATEYDNVRRTVGRMKEFTNGSPVIEILGFSLEEYNRKVSSNEI